MTYEQILEALRALNPEAMFIEPRAMYDPCVIGMTNTPTDSWPRKSNEWVAIYNADLCIRAIVNEIIHENHPAIEGEDIWEMAVNHFEHSVSGAWMGEHTPTFVYGAELDR